jgi:two-component system, OmpR family, sensor kinase
MRLAIRARIALFSALVVCGTVVFFGLVLWALVELGGLASVDRDLVADTPVATFRAAAGPDGRLRVERAGGLGPVPDHLAVPVRTGVYTIAPAPGDHVRVDVVAQPDGTFQVTGEHLAQMEGLAGLLLGYLLFTAIAAMLAGVVAIWVAAGRALGPLRTMAGVAEEVGRTRDLRRRLPAARARHDEVGRLTEAFNDMLVRLEGAQESQRRFVADASHELRTPLTSIRGNAGLLQRDPPAAAEDVRDAVADIAAESERMSRLVEGLLTLARADAGQELRRVPLDLARLVEPVARRADLTALLEEAPMLGDADALTQLAWILADNARRHGGGEGVVWVRRRPRGGVLLAVSDRGPGIPPGEGERIFERFYQPDASRSVGGTGLGLSIARWIVAQHGGRIWAGNDPAGGAVFVVELWAGWGPPETRPADGGSDQ